jgi:SAM-dependent methyltransferase
LAVELKPMPARQSADDRLRTALEPACSRGFAGDLAGAYALIDRLCLHLCFHVVHEFALLKDDPEPVADSKSRIGIGSEADYFVNAVLDILAEEGYAECTAQGWRGCRPCPRDASAELQREARSAFPQALPTLELIERCHDHAPAFLTGREPGMAAIFPRGDLALWERVHTSDRIMSLYADLVQPALQALLGRNAWVLEVGAGTGAVLRRCLPLLRERDTAAYWFTDIGPLFVQRAQAAFGDEGFLRFATVDLNRPLASQGLAPKGFDAVIAVNVLHVARDLPTTLRELRTVLKDSGYLIGAEGSPPDAHRRWRLDLVYAFLCGWWDVKLDPLLRPRPGFLLPTEWRKVLRACGFEPIQVLPGESWFAGPCRGGLIIAGKGMRGVGNGAAEAWDE